MNRIITILVTIFILLLLYIWISHVWGNDKPRHPRQIVDARENPVSGDLYAGADTTTGHAAGNERIPEEPAASEPEAAAPDETPATVKAEEPARAEPEKKKETPPPAPKSDEKKQDQVKKSTPADTRPAVVTTTRPVVQATGQHLVIAGNFTQLANAQRQLQDLKKAGFADAEIVNFDLSEYHTVCAGRFADVNEARRLVKKLKDYHKIDAYLRIGG